jgi:hypothetical protein
MTTRAILIFCSLITLLSGAIITVAVLRAAEAERRRACDRQRDQIEKYGLIEYQAFYAPINPLNCEDM